MLEGHFISDRYLIKKTIGGGGMANVYLAKDTILDREVAIKVLRLEYANDEEFIARFDREAKAATSLSHPNIVNIYDVGEEDHILYMVMEYVDGLTLKEYIRRNGPVPVEKALDIMKQISAAIAHAHANDLVHRDIKPQNILMDKHGNIKVTDFGIAVALSATALTQTNAILGSVHYLSPEQARGGMATKKSDIYSLGIVLYELLTGRLPFSGESPVSIALKHLQSDTPSVRQFNDNIPQSVENIVLKATAKDPFHRYKTVYEMDEALDKALLPENLNEEKYSPPVEVGEETKAIPIITDEQIVSHADDETIIHKIDEGTKVAPKKNKKKKKPKKKKRKRRWLIILFILILLFGAGIVALFLIQPKDIVIPDVSEMEYEEAVEMLEELSLQTEKEMTFSDEIEEDLVVKTEPSAGRTVKENSLVTIIVSEGKETINFDDYVGRDYKQVKRLLEERGFKDISAVEKYSDEPVGDIIAHIEPEAHEDVVPHETNVIFEISAGEELIRLSNLSGMSEDEAKDHLEDLGLKMNKINEHSDTVKEGQVIKTSPDTNASLKAGDVVDVYISEGKKEKPPTLHSVTFTVPYTLQDDNEEQHVIIYVEDMNRDITEVFKEEKITEDKEFTITLTIEPDKDASYKVTRDDEVIIDKTIPFEEGE